MRHFTHTPTPPQTNKARRIVQSLKKLQDSLITCPQNTEASSFRATSSGDMLSCKFCQHWNGVDTCKKPMWKPTDNQNTGLPKKTKNSSELKTDYGGVKKTDFIGPWLWELTTMKKTVLIQTLYLCTDILTLQRESESSSSRKVAGRKKWLRGGEKSQKNKKKQGGKSERLSADRSKVS